MYFRNVIAAVLVFGPFPALGETFRLQVAGDKFNEVVRESAQISGVVVAGVLRHGVGDTGDLSAAIDPTWESEFICVRVLSGDGFYEAENTYVLPAQWDGGLAQFDFPTRHAELLSGLPEGAVAVRVTEGDCSQRQPSAALANWRGAEGGAAALLINAFAADEVFMYVGTQAVACERIAISGLAAFDTSCALPDGLSGRVEITIYRLQGGSASEPSIVRLFLGQL